MENLDSVIEQVRKSLPNVYEYPDKEYFVRISQPEKAQLITEDFNPSPTVQCAPTFTVKFHKRRHVHADGRKTDEWAVEYIKKD